MKPVKYLGLLLAISFIAVPVMNHAVETKLSGEFWGRFTNETAKFKDANAAYVNKTSKNYISLERGYFGLETKFTENTKARFTIDIFSTDKTHEYLSYSASATSSDEAMPIDSLDVDLEEKKKTGSIDGAGLKLKYAFVDFGNLFPVPDLTLTAGLQKVFFGTIYDWDYTLIGKAPTDEYKIVNSADYGVSFNGYLPSGMGEYALGVYNGEGYKKVGSSLKENTDFAYLANLRLTPIPGVTVGGSYIMNTVEAEKKLDGDALVNSYAEENLMDGVLRLAYGPVDIWTEYISKDVKYPNKASDDFKASGFMVMPIVSLRSLIGTDIQVIGRYDSWDESERAATDDSRQLLTAFTGGINYNFLHDESAKPAMQLQLNYTTKNYDEEKTSSKLTDSSQVMLQLKWRFSNTMK